MAETETTERDIEAGGGADQVDEHAGHPGDATYVWVAIILGVLTAFEIGLYYFPPGRIEVPALLALMAIKFAIVVMWFMHLKFDSRLFTRLFTTGLILAVTVYVITLLTFQFF